MMNMMVFYQSDLMILHEIMHEIMLITIMIMITIMML